MPSVVLQGLNQPRPVLFGRVRFFKKSGAYLYLPAEFVKSGLFPFQDGDILKLELDEAKISEDERKVKLVVSAPHWWEQLDWNTMPDAFINLPNDIQEDIKKSMRENERKQLIKKIEVIRKVVDKQTETLKHGEHKALK